MKDNVVKEFIDEYYKLYNKDVYVSKRMLDELYDKYQDVIKNNGNDIQDNELLKKYNILVNYGYQIMDTKNERYVNKHLVIDKEYFDNVFKDVDKNILLDEEQRRAILIDEDYSLIVAGAGSGKTTTMAAKIKYLVEKKHINPNNIILLSFTNKSVNDLNELINNKFKLNVEVLTFHKLGMKFLRESYRKKLEIISDGGIYDVLSKYFLEVVFKNKDLLKEYMKVFSKYLRLDDECLEYSSYDEYYKHYMDKQYELYQNNLKEEINKRVNRRSIYFKTINGEKVKSEGEVKIANYLYYYGIDYQYEMLYPYKLPENRVYKPDFTIENVDNCIYVEYFGLAKIKNKKIASHSEKYLQEIKLKKEIHQKYQTDLLELYGSYESGISPLAYLNYELEKRHFILNKRTDKEIFYRLLETSKTFKYNNLIKLFAIFISLFKEKNYILEDFEKLVNDCSSEDIKKQLMMVKDVYFYYQKEIHQNYQIDFQDMIHYAYMGMDKLKKDNKYLQYDYVLIDEYQDVSYQRYSFARKISDLFHAKIVAVGDDWQTIYSFSGSDIDLFTKFNEIMGYSKKIAIVHTYRNSQELIDLAGDFIIKNNYQLRKKLLSKKHLDKPVKLVYYDYSDDVDNLSDKLEELLIKINEEHPKDKILLLARFNMELDGLLLSKKFYKNNIYDDKIICRKVPNLLIDFLTVHKSKGLGYDRVIILNSLDITYGFPSKIKDEPLIKYLKKDDSEEVEDILYPEERRLFYVALTRTKNELYIMVPKDFNYQSMFIKEIKENNNVSDK